MTKKKKGNDKQVSIKVGDISDVSGTVSIAGRNISALAVTDLTSTEIEKLFKHLYSAVEARPNASPANKADLMTEVKEIHKEVKKAEKDQKPLNESFLARRFHNIANMAPDILEVIVAALPRPISALGVAFKKIAEKAKASKAKAETS
jgi:hypothetical protein